jgi:anti-sigma B factor antagonist
MDGGLEVRVDRVGDAPTIHLAGRIDRDAEAGLAEAWAAATTDGTDGTDGTHSVVLDFSAADYINSTGIALIVRLLADARRLHREVRARGLTEHYREIFRITRLSDFMTIEADAVGTARGLQEDASHA